MADLPRVEEPAAAQGDAEPGILTIINNSERAIRYTSWQPMGTDSYTGFDILAIEPGDQHSYDYLNPDAYAVAVLMADDGGDAYPAEDDLLLYDNILVLSTQGVDCNQDKRKNSQNRKRFLPHRTPPSFTILDGNPRE